MEYRSFENGKYTKVYDFDDCIEALQCRNRDNEAQISDLKAENKKLKEDMFKDEALLEMRRECEAMRDDYLRGFPITEEEQEEIEQWKKGHTVKGQEFSRIRKKSCGSYKYMFIPTNLGIFGKIVCQCGAEFEFQKIE